MTRGNTPERQEVAECQHCSNEQEQNTFNTCSQLNISNSCERGDLTEQLRRFEELDAKRTQGEWRSGKPIFDGRTHLAYVGTDVNHEHVTGIWGHDGYNIQCRAQDAAFIAAAPQMAAIIAQLWAEREQQRAVMVQAIADLELCRPEHVTRPIINSLNAALGEV